MYALIIVVSALTGQTATVHAFGPMSVEQCHEVSSLVPARAVTSNTFVTVGCTDKLGATATLTEGVCVKSGPTVSVPGLPEAYDTFWSCAGNRSGPVIP